MFVFRSDRRVFHRLAYTGLVQTWRSVPGDWLGTGWTGAAGMFLHEGRVVHLRLLHNLRMPLPDNADRRRVNTKLYSTKYRPKNNFVFEFVFRV